MLHMYPMRLRSSHPVSVHGRIGANHASAASNWLINSCRTAFSECNCLIAVKAWKRIAKGYEKGYQSQAIGTVEPELGIFLPRPKIEILFQLHVSDTSHQGMSLRTFRVPSPWLLSLHQH